MEQLADTLLLDRKEFIKACEREDKYLTTKVAIYGLLRQHFPDNPEVVASWMSTARPEFSGQSANEFIAAGDRATRIKSVYDMLRSQR